MRRCAYCSQPTRVIPFSIRDQGPLARLPHSPLKVKRGQQLPLCVAARQGVAAQKRAAKMIDDERSFTEHDESLERSA